MPVDQTTHLRQRARHLRHLAHMIETSPVMHLEPLASDETWRGPRPNLCVNVLRSNLAQLHHAAEQLRRQAYVFDQRADAQTVLPTG